MPIAVHPSRETEASEENEEQLSLALTEPTQDNLKKALNRAKMLMPKFQILHASVSFWRRSTFDKPPPLWKKLATVDSGLYDGAFPHVGGSISVRTDDQGFSFVLDARVCTRTMALLNVDEHDNTFEAILEVTLEWEVEQTQFDVCQDFWDTFRPQLSFQNAVDSSEAPEPIFDEKSTPLENGCLMLRDERDGKRTILRHFEYKRRTQRKFRQPLDLVHFPFDVQTLPITFYSSRTFMYGRPIHLRLRHPMARDDFNCSDPTNGAHVFDQNADCVDDMQTETLFALEGSEMLPELDKVPDPGTPEARVRTRHDEYTLLIFVSRQYKSTIYNVHVPLFFMYILSFLAYFIPPCAVVDRASVSLTLLLTTVALKTYMSDKLPSVPYCCAAENFLLYITVCLLFQSVMMGAAASSCVRFGAAGQFGFDLQVLKKIENGDYDEDVPDVDWDCRTQENNFDFWCANRRARIQSLLDMISIWTSISIGVFTIFKHIIRRIVLMYKALFYVHRHKFLSESPDLFNDPKLKDPKRKRHSVESMLCFFAIRHADDHDAWAGFRVLFDAFEPLCWRVHGLLRWFSFRFGGGDPPEPLTNDPPCQLSPRALRARGSTPSSSPSQTQQQQKDDAKDGGKKKKKDSAVRRWSKELCLTGPQCCSTGTPNEEKSKKYFEKRKNASQFFAHLGNRRAVGYDNDLYYHGFRRPPWEKPEKRGMLRRAATEQVINALSGADEGPGLEIETRKVILFDCGTGETKPLQASLVSDGSTSEAHVVINDKPGGSFAQGKRKIEMPDYCFKGETRSFIQWMESHVAPSFDVEIEHSRGLEEKDVHLEKLFGFTVEPVKKDLYQIKALSQDHALPESMASPKTPDGVCLLTPKKGMALVSVNGAPYSEDAAKKAVVRAANLSRHFRNPKLYDRVAALTTIYFAELRPKGDRDCYLGDAVALGDLQSGDESPCGVVLPGQKGTIVREARGANVDATHVAYFVVWDDEPALGTTLVKQRHYLKGLAVSDALETALIKPIPEVHLACLCHAEAAKYEWQEPVVVVGTGAWFRNSREKIRDNASDMFKEIERRHPTWKIERNTEFDEAWFEDLSVRYIHQKWKLHAPDAVLAVGNGSTQYSSIVPPDVRDRVVFKEREHGELIRAIVAARYWRPKELNYQYKLLIEPPGKFGPNRQYNDAPVEVRDNVWAHQLVTLSPLSDRCDDDPMPTECKVPSLIQNGNRRGKSFFESRLYHPDKVAEELEERRKQWSTHAKEVLRDLIKQDRICKGVPSYVCCISACHYAAKFAGCRTHPDVVSVGEAKEKYRAALDGLISKAAQAALKLDPPPQSPVTIDEIMKQVVLDYKAEDENKYKAQIDSLRNGKGGSTVLSNLTYQCALIDMFFNDSTLLRICRDWEKAGYTFRTTWTSGYYLNWLRGQRGITIPI